MADGLDWLAGGFSAHYPDDLPPPYLYPTAEGQVRAEWSIKPEELSLVIDLQTFHAAWHALNLDDDAEQTKKLKLDSESDWDWLVAETRRLVEVGA